MNFRLTFAALKSNVNKCNGSRMEAQRFPKFCTRRLCKAKLSQKALYKVVHHKISSSEQKVNTNR